MGKSHSHVKPASTGQRPLSRAARRRRRAQSDASKGREVSAITAARKEQI